MSCLCPGKDASQYNDETCVNLLKSKQPQETVPCNQQPCCHWTSWSPWGQCSDSCKGGHQSRRRDCWCPSWGDMSGYDANVDVCKQRTTMTSTQERTCNPMICTHTQNYWRMHNLYAPSLHDRTPWPISENTRFNCTNVLNDTMIWNDTWSSNSLPPEFTFASKSWVEIINEPDRNNAWLLLAHAYIATALNIKYGTSYGDDTTDAMHEALDLIQQCDIFKSNDLTRATKITSILSNYNTGQIGPGNYGGVDEALDSGGRIMGGGSSENTDGSEEDDKFKFIVPIIIPLFVVIVLLVVCFVLFRSRKRTGLNYVPYDEDSNQDEESH